MRRLVCIFLSVFILLSLTSCGSVVDTGADRTNSKEKQESSFVSKQESKTESKENIKEETTQEIEEPKEESKEESKEEYIEYSKYYEEESEKTESKVVYKTPTGKRYHLDPDCGGKNSRETTLEKALAIGLTPCKKCAQ